MVLERIRGSGAKGHKVEKEVMKRMENEGVMKRSKEKWLLDWIE